MTVGSAEYLQYLTHKSWEECQYGQRYGWYGIREDFDSGGQTSIVKDDSEALGILGLDCRRIAAKSNFSLINYITKPQRSKEQKASEGRKLSALLELKDKIVLPAAPLKEDKLSMGAFQKEKNVQLKLFELQSSGSMGRGKKKRQFQWKV